MTRFCSLAINTTGQHADLCNVIEIGAVIDDTTNPIDDDERPEFHSYILEDVYQGEPSVLSVLEADLGRIARKEKPFRYLTPAAAIHDLSGWLHEYWGDTDPVLFAGKNLGIFDFKFLTKMPGWSDYIIYRPGVLDPGPLFMDPKKDSGLPTLDTCCERAGIEYPDEEDTVLQQAQLVAEVLQAYYGKKKHKGWLWHKKRT